MRCFARCGLALLPAALAGCVQTGSADVSVVLSHGNCQQIEQGATVIDYGTLAKLRGAQLLDLEAPATEGAGAPVLVAVSLGTRPTLGFRLEPVGAPRIEGDVLTIRVTAVGPPPDAVVAQMLSQPCLVFAIGDTAARRVVVEDPDGAPIGAVELVRAVSQ